MRFRFHKGALEDSMKTVIEVDNIENLSIKISEYLGIKIKSNKIQFKYLSFDKRTDCNTYLVSIKLGVIGYSDSLFDSKVNLKFLTLN